MNEPTYLTAEGRERLKEELRRMITVERPAVAQAIGEAKGLGDISDNGEYETAKNSQAFLEGRIAAAELALRNAVLIDHTESAEVEVGSRVTIRAADGEEMNLTIVGDFEARDRTENISNKSPVARALLGHRAGDKIDISTPGGVDSYELISVS